MGMGSKCSYLYWVNFGNVLGGYKQCGQMTWDCESPYACIGV